MSEHPPPIANLPPVAGSPVSSPVITRASAPLPPPLPGNEALSLKDLQSMKVAWDQFETQLNDPENVPYQDDVIRASPYVKPLASRIQVLPDHIPLLDDLSSSATRQTKSPAANQPSSARGTKISDYLRNCLKLYACNGSFVESGSCPSDKLPFFQEKQSSLSLPTGSHTARKSRAMEGSGSSSGSRPNSRGGPSTDDTELLDPNDLEEPIDKETKKKHRRSVQSMGLRSSNIPLKIDIAAVKKNIESIQTECEEERSLYRKSVLGVSIKERMIPSKLPKSCEAHELFPPEKMYVQISPMRLDITQDLVEPLFATASLWGYDGGDNKPVKLSADWSFHFVKRQLISSFLSKDTRLHPLNQLVRRGVLCYDASITSRFNESQLYLLIQVHRMHTDDDSARHYEKDHHALKPQYVERVSNALNHSAINDQTTQDYALQSFAWGCTKLVDIVSPDDSVNPVHLPLLLISTRTTRRRFKLEQIQQLFDGRYKSGEVHGKGIYFLVQRIQASEVWNSLCKTAQDRLAHSPDGQPLDALATKTPAAAVPSTKSSPAEDQKQRPNQNKTQSTSGKSGEAQLTSRIASQRLDLCILDEYTCGGAWLAPSPWLYYMNDLFLHQLVLESDKKGDYMVTMELVDCRRSCTLEAAYSRYSSCDRVPRACTTVQHVNSKQCDFADELRIRLPYDFREPSTAYCILFRVVSVKMGNDKPKNWSRNVVAYGLLPLSGGSRGTDTLLGQEMVEIPLTLEAPPELNAIGKKLSEQRQGKIKHRLVARMAFRSSLFPRDQTLRDALSSKPPSAKAAAAATAAAALSKSNLSDSLAAMSTGSDGALSTVNTGTDINTHSLADVIIRSVTPVACNDYFPHLCTLILDRLCLASDEHSCALAFRALIVLLNKMFGASRDPKLQMSRILFFVDYLYMRTQDAEAPLYERIAEQWSLLADDKDVMEKLTGSTSGVLYALMLKSLLAELTANSDLQVTSKDKMTEDGQDHDGVVCFRGHRDENASSNFLKHVTTLLPHNLGIFDGIGSDFAPLFVNGLLSTLNRGRVLQTVDASFSERMRNDPELQNWIGVGRAMHIIESHPQVVALSLPNLSVRALANLSGRSMQTGEFHECIRLRFRNTHYIPSLLIDQIRVAMERGHINASSELTTTLRAVLKAFRKKVREEGGLKEGKPHPSAVFFPFVLVVLDNQWIFAGAEDDEVDDENEDGVKATDLVPLRRLVLVCVLEILSCCRGSLLSGWLRMSATSMLHAYLDILRVSLCLLSDARWDQSKELAPRWIILDLVEDFVAQFSGDLSSERGQLLLEKVFALFFLMLREERNECTAFVANVCLSLNSVVHRFEGVLFGHGKFLCQELLNEVVSHVGSQLQLLRDRSVSLVYYILCRSYLALGAEGYTKYMSTRLHIAVSLFLGPRRDGEYCKKMSCALQAISAQASADAEAEDSQEDHLQLDAAFAECTCKLVSELEKVTQSQLLICGGNVDPDLRVEHFVTLSNNFFLVPDLRVTWLRNLAQEHENEQRYVEAAQCALLEAYLCVCFLRHRRGEPIPLTHELFERVIPNLNKLPGIPSAREVPDKEFSGQCWSFAQGVVPALDRAARLLSRRTNDVRSLPAFAGKAPVAAAPLETNYEAALNVIQMLQIAHTYDNNFRALLATCGRYERVVAQIMVQQQDRSNAETNYYYLRFHAPKFPRLNGKRYIYKSLLANRSFSERLKLTLDSAYDVDVLLSPVPSEVDSHSDVGLAVLVITVQPYYEEISVVQDEMAKEEAKSLDGKVVVKSQPRVTTDQMHMNIRHFSHETGVKNSADPPKPKSEMTESEKTEWEHYCNATSAKTRVIVSTKHAFPHLERRVEVCKETVVELSGVETRMDELKKQISHLRTALHSTPPNLGKLEQLLFGTFCAGVGGGLIPLCRIYLDPDAKAPGNEKNFVEEAQKLRLVVAELLQLAKIGVKVFSRDSPNRALVTELQKNIEEFETIFSDKYWKGPRFSIWRSDWSKAHKQEEEQSQRLLQKFNTSAVDLRELARRPSATQIKRSSVKKSNRTAGDASEGTADQTGSLSARLPKNFGKSIANFTMGN